MMNIGVGDSCGKLELDDAFIKKTKNGRTERLTTILKDYWDIIRKNKTFPIESVFDFRKINDIWDSCFLVNASNETREDDYFYKHIGEQIKNAYRNELSNLELDRIVNTQACHLSREFEKVLAMKIPIYYEGEITIDENRIMKYRQILLPLGKDDVNIQSIMGGFSYKIFNNS